MGTIQTGVLRHESSYPKLLLSQEKIVYNFRWQIVHIRQAVNNLKQKMPRRGILVNTVIDEMFNYTTGVSTFGNVRFVIR